MTRLRSAAPNVAAPRTSSHDTEVRSVWALLRNCAALLTVLIVFFVPQAEASTGEVQALASAALDLVATKDYRTASARFAELAERDPGNSHWRNWVARLKSWQGDFAGAEIEYRLILMEVGPDLEAELGLADVIAWQKRYDEAIDRLLVLQSEHPENAQVLVRLGRILRWSLRPSEARPVLLAAAAADPMSSEVRDELRALENTPEAMQGRTRVMVTPQEWKGRPMQAGEARLQWTVNPRLTVEGRRTLYEDAWERQELTSVRTIVRPTDNVTAKLEYMHSSQIDLMPSTSWTAEVMARLDDRFTIGGAVSESSAGVSVTKVNSLIFDYTSPGEWHLHARYTPTTVQIGDSRAETQGGWVRLSVLGLERVRPWVVAGIGVPSEQHDPADAVRDENSVMAGAGGSILLSEGQTLDVSWSRVFGGKRDGEWDATVQYRLLF